MEADHQPKPRSLNPWLIVGGGILALILAFIYIWIAGLIHNPVPRDIRRAVPFPVYYPQSSKLPAGYVLNESSFRQAQPGVIIFSIGRSGGQRVIVSEEKPPPQNTIDDFLKAYIPLNTEISTKLGTAKSGAFGSAPNLRGIASLVVKNGPWIILTSPANTSQSDVKAIIESLRR